MLNMMKMIIIIFSWYFLIPSAIAQEVHMEPRYNIFKDFIVKPDATHPNYHPFMAGGKREAVIFSVQEEDILKVAFYSTRVNMLFARFDVYNPSRKSFVGVPARCISNGNFYGIEFADGTVLWPYLPPDAQNIGSSSWTYEMRWRRVYKNYYYVIVNRGADTTCFEYLVTEKNGLDISTRLGDSSINANKRDYNAVWLGEKVKVDAGIFVEGKDDPTFILTPVDEKDLPPDFPKGLVRWLP